MAATAQTLPERQVQGLWVPVASIHIWTAPLVRMLLHNTFIPRAWAVGMAQLHLFSFIKVCGLLLDVNESFVASVVMSVCVCRLSRTSRLGSSGGGSGITVYKGQTILLQTETDSPASFCTDQSLWGIHSGTVTSPFHSAKHLQSQRAAWDMFGTFKVCWLCPHSWQQFPVL